MVPQRHTTTRRRGSRSRPHRTRHVIVDSSPSDEERHPSNPTPTTQLPVPNSPISESTLTREINRRIQTLVESIAKSGRQTIVTAIILTQGSEVTQK
ncbi:hypothetical protein GEMRC1_009609 [Eukaryota sp. GEM-RC1]